MAAGTVRVREQLLVVGAVIAGVRKVGRQRQLARGRQGDGFSQLVLGPQRSKPGGVSCRGRGGGGGSQDGGIGGAGLELGKNLLGIEHGA